MSFLGLFGGNDSTSTTNTTQYNTQMDGAAQAYSQGVAVNGAVNGSGSLVQNISNTTLDGQVAISAMDHMLTSNQDSLLFASDAQKQAYGFGNNVLSFATANNNAVLQFASDSNATTTAFATAQTQAANAQTSAAIGTASDAMTQALKFGSQQTGVALDALAGSAAMIDTAYKDAKGVLGTNVIMMGIGATVLVLYFALRK